MPPVKNEPMVQNILFMFIFIGLIIKFFLSQKTSEDGLTGPATATKWGFGIILISVSLLIFISIGQLTETGLISIIPHFIMIGTIIWFILININHGERINDQINQCDDYIDPVCRDLKSEPEQCGTQLFSFTSHILNCVAQEFSEIMTLYDSESIVGQ